MKSARPNVAGYLVLAAFAGFAAWAVTATAKGAPLDPSKEHWLPVSEGKRIIPGLQALWTPADRINVPGYDVPEYYDRTAKVWVWLVNGREESEFTRDDVLVMPVDQ